MQFLQQSKIYICLSAYTEKIVFLLFFFTVPVYTFIEVSDYIAGLFSRSNEPEVYRC